MRTTLVGTGTPRSRSSGVFQVPSQQITRFVMAALLHGKRRHCSPSTPSAPPPRRGKKLVVLGRVQPGKQHIRETELAEVADSHGVELADEVIAFVLHHACVEALGDSVDSVALLVE